MDDESKFIEAGVNCKPVHALNLQSSGVIEGAHQTMAQTFLVMIKEKKPATQAECDQLVEDGLAVAVLF